jgi:hypothetical protein
MGFTKRPGLYPDLETSPVYVKRKLVFPLKSFSPWFLRNETVPYGQLVPGPGKKAFASPKKAAVPLF